MNLTLADGSLWLHHRCDREYKRAAVNYVILFLVFRILICLNVSIQGNLRNMANICHGNAKSTSSLAATSMSVSCWDITIQLVRAFHFSQIVTLRFEDLGESHILPASITLRRICWCWRDAGIWVRVDASDRRDANQLFRDGLGILSLCLLNFYASLCVLIAEHMRQQVRLVWRYTLCCTLLSIKESLCWGLQS